MDIASIAIDTFIYIGVNMKAIIWTKKDCPYCVEAKSILENRGYEIEDRIIGAPYLKEDLLAVLPDAKTVPQIFLDDVYIGGCDDLKKHFGIDS